MPKKETISKKLSKKITDVRRLRFLELYLTPGTKYFNNGYQSALKAGFTEATAKNILAKDFKWLEDGIKTIYGTSVDAEKLANKSRKVLDQSLDSEDKYLAQNTAKFVSSHIDPEFTQKQEINHHFPEPIYGGKSKAEVKEGEI